MSDSIQVMRLSEVIAMTGLCKTTLRNRMKSGLFPTTFRMAGQTSGIFKHEVEVTINAMAAGISDKELQQLVLILESERKKRASKFLEKAAA